MSCLRVTNVILLFLVGDAIFVHGVPYTSVGSDGDNVTSKVDSHPSPVFHQDVFSAKLIPLGSTPEPTNRTGRFFGLTTGYGNGLQLGLSFIVPFLNIPYGYNGGSSPSFFGSNYDNAPSYGSTSSSTSLLGLNTGSIIFAIVIGIAAIVLIPIIIYSITGVGTSPFGRSDSVQDILTGLMSRVDDALTQQNIDVPSCVQRVVCTSVRSSKKRMNDGTAGSIEKIVEGFATNDYLISLLDGTKIHKAIDTARKQGTPCTEYERRCPYSLDSIYQSVASYNDVNQGNGMGSKQI